MLKSSAESQQSTTFHEVILNAQLGFEQSITQTTEKLLVITLNLLLSHNIHKNSSGDEIANVNFFYNIAHVEASAYAHVS